MTCCLDCNNSPSQEAERVPFQGAGDWSRQNSPVAIARKRFGPDPFSPTHHFIRGSALPSAGNQIDLRSADQQSVAALSQRNRPVAVTDHQRRPGGHGCWRRRAATMPANNWRPRVGRGCPPRCEVGGPFAAVKPFCRVVADSARSPPTTPSRLNRVPALPPALTAYFRQIPLAT